MIHFQHVSYCYSNTANFAVRDISFSIPKGQLGLITGVSGCGKTTLMRLANGLCPEVYGGTLSGEITIAKRALKNTSIAMLSDVVGTLFQDPEEQFFALNVEDEMAFALRARGMHATEIHHRVDHAAQKLNILPLLKQDIHTLSEGQKQKVGLASLLALGVRIFVLDEPSANLDVQSTQDLGQILNNLKNEGCTILVVDHRLYWLKDIADQVLVMQNGRIVESGDFTLLESKELTQKWGLRQAVIEDCREQLPCLNCTEEGIFSCRNVCFAYPHQAPIFTNFSFAAPAGITALLGENGSGKTTLARILTGLNKAEGAFFLHQRQQIHLMKFSGLVLQNAEHQLQMQSVYAEIHAAFSAAQNFGQHAADADQIERLLQELNLLPLKNRHPQSLSGGEKQRLVIACALAKNPAILILDEPTSGLDGENLKAIARILQKKAQEGMAIFLITHDLELLQIATHALHI